MARDRESVQSRARASSSNCFPFYTRSGTTQNAATLRVQRENPQLLPHSATLDNSLPSLVTVKNSSGFVIPATIFADDGSMREATTINRKSRKFSGSYFLNSEL